LIKIQWFIVIIKVNYNLWNQCWFSTNQ